MTQHSTLTERERRLIYSRAFEAILWASPVLAVYCQAEAGGPGQHKICWQANNSLERTPLQPTFPYEARFHGSGLLRCMMDSGLLSSQPLGAYIENKERE